MKFIIGFILLNLSISGYAQNDCKCSLKNLATVNQHLGKLSANDVDLLLCTFDKSCKNNSEFSAFSNEVLFEVLSRKPGIVIDQLTVNKEKYEINQILAELESPIHDGFEISQILEQVKAVKGNEEIKSLILNSLEKAIEKENR